MKKTISRTIFLVTSIIATGVGGILTFITGAQTIMGEQTVSLAAKVVYDQSDTQAIAQVHSAASFQLAFLAASEVALLIAGILGLRFAIQKTSKTSTCLIFAGLGLVTWIGELIAWSKYDTLMRQYDIYPHPNDNTVLTLGVILFIGICISYAIGAFKFKQETSVITKF